LQYRREIDGLRACAVVAVILFHAGFETFSGGYIGVDVFFVISGYLITSIILSDLQNNKFLLGDFYRRRARRILPALAVVLCACIPLSWLTMVPFQIEDFAQSLIATLGFGSNVLFWIESGYFQPEAELKPLLHTWSLAVEEQFYVLFPLLMLLLRRFGRTILVVFLILVLFASLLLSSFWIERSPAAAFYLLPSRAWELLLGALLACSAIYKVSIRTTPSVRECLAMTGCVLILAPIFIYDEETPFPGLTAIAPTLGAVLIIANAHQDTAIGRLLGWKPLVTLGLMSYSAYLWHQPLFAYHKIHFGLDASIWARILILAATMCLSFLTWRCVEIPFRKAGSIHVGKQLGSGMLVASLVILYAVPAYTSEGFYDTKLNAIPEKYKPYVLDRTLETELRYRISTALATEQKMPFSGKKDLTRVLILGDSLSEDLFTAFRTNAQLFETREFRNLRLDDKCYSAAAKRLVDKTLDTKLESRCAIEIPALLQSSLLKQSEEVIIHANSEPFNARDARELVRELLGQGKIVYLVGLLTFNDASSISMKLHRARQAPETLFYENLRQKYLDVNKILEANIKDLGGAYYLDKFALFCSHERKRCDVFDEKRKPIFVDGNHLTVKGMSVFGQTIAEANWLESN